MTRTKIKFNVELEINGTDAKGTVDWIQRNLNLLVEYDTDDLYVDYFNISGIRSYETEE